MYKYIKKIVAIITVLMLISVSLYAAPAGRSYKTYYVDINNDYADDIVIVEEDDNFLDDQIVLIGVTNIVPIVLKVPRIHNAYVLYGDSSGDFSNPQRLTADKARRATAGKSQVTTYEANFTTDAGNELFIPVPRKNVLSLLIGGLDNFAPFIIFKRFNIGDFDLSDLRMRVSIGFDNATGLNTLNLQQTGVKGFSGLINSLGSQTAQEGVFVPNSAYINAHDAALNNDPHLASVGKALSPVAGEVFGERYNPSLVSELIGDASVGSMGQSQYNLALNLPKGLNGLEPGISLQYTQGSNSGEVGLGVKLTGLSMITRCSTIKDIEGYVGGVNFTDTDRYCLNGQRLIAVNGNNGGSGTEYRVKDSASIKVISRGQQGYGPQRWEVYDQSGYISDYGLDSSARDAGTKGVYAWYNSRVRDRFDNALDYHFINDANKKYLDKITYQQYEVKFNYANRPDKASAFEYGISKSLNKLLKNVQIKVSNTLQRQYNLSYELVQTRGAVQHSRLKKINLCDAYQKCTKPLEYSWKQITIPNNNDGTAAVSQKTFVKVDAPDGYVVGDIDNDGSNDICWYENKLYCKTKSQTLTVASFESLWDGSKGDIKEEKMASLATLSLIDINNDGKIDYCLFTATGFYCGRNNGSSFENGSYWSTEFTSQDSVQFFDYNQDKLLDLCYFGSNREGLICAINNGAGFDISQVVFDSPELFQPFEFGPLSKGSFLSWEPYGYSYADGWRYDAYYNYTPIELLPRPRLLDINGNGTPDICAAKFLHPNNIEANASWEMKCVQGRISTTLNSQNNYKWVWDSEPVSVLIEDSPAYISLINEAYQKQKTMWERATIESYPAGSPRGNQPLGFPPIEGTYSNKYIPLFRHKSNNQYYIETPALVHLGNSKQLENLNAPDVSLKAKFADINNDGLVDICYRIEQDFNCRLNQGGSYSPATTWFTTTGTFWSDSSTAHRKYYESTITLIDRNGDGLADMCYVTDHSLQCAYNNNKGKFVALEELMALSADLTLFNKVESVYFHPVRKWFGLNTKMVYRSMDWIYGPLKQVADLDGDGASDICYRSGDGIRCGLLENQPLALLESVTSAFGVKTEFEYASTSDEQDLPTYNRTYHRSYSIIDSGYGTLGGSNQQYLLNPNIKLVSHIKRDNGIDGTNIIRYRYQNMRIDPQEGNLGFDITEKSDLTSGVTTRNSYDLIDGKHRILRLSETFIGESADRENSAVSNSSNSHGPVQISVSLGKLLSSEELKYERVASPYPGSSYTRLLSSQQKSLDIEGNLLSLEKATYSAYDDYNMPAKVVIEKGNGLSSQTTQTQYAHNPSKWLIGQPQQTVVTDEAINKPTMVKKVSYEYYANGSVDRQVIGVGSGSQGVLTKYGYNNLGNRTALMTYTSAGKQRFSTTEYDSLGREIAQTNALGHRSSITYDAKCSLPSTVTDINGLVARTEYDSLCRPKKTISPDGNFTSTSFHFSDGADRGIDNNQIGYNLDDASLYMQVTSNNQGAWSKTYYDRLGREVRKSQFHANNSESQDSVISDIVYDAQGRIVAQSSPHFGGAGRRYWARTKYDKMGRVAQRAQQTQTQGEIISTYDYDGLIASVNAPEGYTKTTERDLLGRTVRTSDAKNGTVKYQYDAMGNVDRTDTNGQIVKLTYNTFGRKIAMQDPAMGSWKYDYNGYGKLIWQQDAKGQITTIEYDKLNRPTVRNENGVITQWEYDRGNKALGQLTQETNGTVTKSINYDALARPATSITSYANTDYASEYTYNSFGQLSSIRHPNGLNVQRDYDASGALKRVSIPLDDIVDVDWDAIEKQFLAVKKTGEELEAVSLVAYKDAHEKIWEAEQIRAAAQEARASSNISQAQLDQLRDDYDQSIESAQYFLAEADAARITAQEFWLNYGNRVFKYVQSAAGIHYYKYNRCVDENWKGSCRKMESFQQSITDRLTIRKGAIENPPGLINFNDLFLEWADYYQTLYNEHAASANTTQSQMDTWQRNISTLQLSAAQHTQEAAAILNSAQEQLDDIDNIATELAAQVALHKEIAMQNEDEDSFTLWAALNRSPTGQLVSAWYGNGYQEFATLDAATGVVQRQQTRKIAPQEGVNRLVRDNVYEYNDLGFLTSIDYQGGASSGNQEVFSYDEIGQLKTWQYNGSTLNKHHSYQYDDLGNITFKTDAGTMSYNANNNRLRTRSHNNQNFSYSYDANGNQTSGEGRNFSWNSFNKVSQITQGNQTANYVYDGGHELIKETLVKEGGGQRTTLYLGNGYQVITDNTNPAELRVEEKHSISAGGSTVAVHKKVTVNGERIADSTHYLHKNVQGSSQLVTDEKGQLVMESAYTPYGQELEIEALTVDNWKRDDLDHFTGHDAIDGFGLINMKARLYDPVTARFISPDTVVPDPSNVLSYNRYVYVHNNPVNYVDPTGHFLIYAAQAFAAVAAYTLPYTSDNSTLQSLGQVFQVGANIAISLGSSGLASGVWGLNALSSAAFAGATTGFVNGFVASGGSFGSGAEGAVMGGASAAVTFALAHGLDGSGGPFGDASKLGFGDGGFYGLTGAHAIAQGVFSELRGGNFRDGAIGAVFAKIGGQLGKASGFKVGGESAIVAGVAYLGSKALGSNDDDAVMQAMTAAITVFLYNDEIGEKDEPDEGQIKNFFSTMYKELETWIGYIDNPSLKNSALAKASRAGSPLGTLIQSAVDPEHMVNYIDALKADIKKYKQPGINSPTGLVPTLNVLPGVGTIDWAQYGTKNDPTDYIYDNAYNGVRVEK